MSEASTDRDWPQLWKLGDPVEPIKRLLAQGGVLAVPTESSYGLAVDPRSAAGVEAIYEVKQREARKPLPIVVANAAQADQLGLDTESEAFAFGARFWPAPLTMLIPVRDRSPLALGDLDFIAVRIPSHQPLLELLNAVGIGLTATSANLSGRPALTEVSAVQTLLGGRRMSAVMDSAPLAGGAPSTVVAWQDGRASVLRQGRFVVPEDTPSTRQSSVG